jgi:hypothetical protein
MSHFSYGVMRSKHSRGVCACCGVLTSFEREVRGPRGAHIRWEWCCADCGEHLRAAKKLRATA